MARAVISWYDAAWPTVIVPLTPARRSTLGAVVGAVLPPSTPESRVNDVTRLVEDRLRTAPAPVTQDLVLALDVIGSRLAGLVVTARPARISGQSPIAAARSFARWATSPLPMARAVHEALRKLVLTTWYATPEGHRSVGVLPPLHLRDPAFPWEGPAPGVQSRDDEPVARSPDRTAIAGRNPPRSVIPDAVVTASELTGDRELHADVVIVGSGAGGSVAAARFAERGRKVVILEAGDFFQAADFSEDESALVPRLFADQAMRATTDGSVTLLQGGAVGGGTTVNWMLMLRPSPEVLSEWSGLMGADGFGAHELSPHLDRVEAEVHATLAPDDAHAPSNRAILDGSSRLGWRARAAKINARQCVRAGTCSLGCRYDAKQSALVTYLPRAFAAGATLFAGVAAERIELPGSGPYRTKRIHAVARDAQGKPGARVVVDAPIVVLAAGAIGTPVLLERSGLGGGAVGSYLRLHPTTAVMGHYPQATYPLAGVPQTALCDEFIRRDAHGHGFWIECPALQPALAAAALPGIGQAHFELMQQLGHTVAFIVLVRDGAGTSRSMGHVRLDKQGRARIHYRLTPGDRENLRFGIEAAGRLHLAAGATDALSLHTPMVRATTGRELHRLRSASVAPNRIALFSAHVNGTCRLGSNSRTSGCRASGERHGVPGLYVMDGSLLPTAPGVNPQETIMAVASLLAERALT